MNLILRTNCIEIDEAMSGKFRAPDRDRELERLQGIEQLNHKALCQIRNELLRRIEMSMINLRVSDVLKVEDNSARDAVGKRPTAHRRSTRV